MGEAIGDAAEAAAPPVAERVTFRGRKFKSTATSASPAPAPACEGASAEAGAGSYESRVSRARAANRTLGRSTSSAALNENGGKISPEAEPTGARVQAPTRLSGATASVAQAMQAEVERADCREMVRDVTHAVLPTRGAAASGLARPSADPLCCLGEAPDFAPVDLAACEDASTADGPRSRPAVSAAAPRPRMAGPMDRGREASDVGAQLCVGKGRRFARERLERPDVGQVEVARRAWRQQRAAGRVGLG